MSRTNERLTCATTRELRKRERRKSGHGGFVFQRGNELRFRRLQRGNEAEENPRRDREQEREGENAPVGAQIEEQSNVDRQPNAAHG